MTSDSGESRLKQISEAVGLLAAVVAVIYLLGALVLALRLQTHQLPTLGVLSNLPRELVISVGMTYAVVPWLVAAAAVALFWLLRKKTPEASESTRLVTRAEVIRCLVVAAVGVAFAWVVLWELGTDVTVWDPIGLAASAVLVALLATALWRLASRRDEGTRTRGTAIVLAAAFAGLVVVPPFVAIGARAPLDPAQLCGEGPTHLKGWLVGEAGDRVYIGENVSPHRIVSATRTGELYVGPDATAALLCGDERLLEPTSDQLVAAALAAKPCHRCAGVVSADPFLPLRALVRGGCGRCRPFLRRAAAVPAHGPRAGTWSPPSRTIAARVPPSRVERASR